MEPCLVRGWSDTRQCTSSIKPPQDVDWPRYFAVWVTNSCQALFLKFCLYAMLCKLMHRGGLCIGRLPSFANTFKMIWPGSPSHVCELMSWRRHSHKCVCSFQMSWVMPVIQSWSIYFQNLLGSLQARGDLVVETTKGRTCPSSGCSMVFMTRPRLRTAYPKWCGTWRSSSCSMFPASQQDSFWRTCRGCWQLSWE